jgi:hypothetical protein
MEVALIIAHLAVPVRPAVLSPMIKIRTVILLSPALVNAPAALVVILPMVLIQPTALSVVMVLGAPLAALMVLVQSPDPVLSINVLVLPPAVPALLPARIMNLLI